MTAAHLLGEAVTAAFYGEPVLTVPSHKFTYRQARYERFETMDDFEVHPGGLRPKIYVASRTAFNNI